MKVILLKGVLCRPIVVTLTLAVAYAVMGWLGLWLAIPPGYATVLWLPSGLAIAWVLMGGARVWPGIWLGSFLANLWTAFDATSTGALLTSVAIPAGIGVGATLQALLGTTLVHRTLGVPTRLGTSDHRYADTGRAGELPGQRHCRGHNLGGQRPDPAGAVWHPLGDMVGGGHARRPHPHAAGAELAR
jgi:hypothetical protein